MLAMDVTRSAPGHQVSARPFDEPVAAVSAAQLVLAANTRQLIIRAREIRNAVASNDVGAVVAEQDVGVDSKLSRTMGLES
jgi:hypothetical protein